MGVVRAAGVALVAVAALLLAVLSAAPAGAAAPRGIHKIKRIVIIMQENRSFDSYFGTYRGGRNRDARRSPDRLRA